MERFVLTRRTKQIIQMTTLMMKIKDNRLTVSVAGMPPVLIYRATTGCVEESRITRRRKSSITLCERAARGLARARRMMMSPSSFSKSKTAPPVMERTPRYNR